jgi:hypothetical protein
MKFVFICLIGMLFLGCNPNNPTPNPTASTSSWKFTVKINGVIYKAEGPSIDFSNPANYAIVGTDNPTWIVELAIQDPTNSSHISGANGTLTMGLYSPSLGVNNLTSIDCSWLQNVPNAAWGYGYSLTNGGPVVPNTSQGGSSTGIYLPINITDLGTSNGGNSTPLKGDYSGIIFVPNIQDVALNSNPTFNIPVIIEISFEAARW